MLTLKSASRHRGSTADLSYVPIAQPRFAVETTGDGEQVRVKARAHPILVVFLTIWLAGWTVGGGVVILQLLTEFEAFLVVWLCGWATAWVAVAVSLIWMFTGSETLRVVGTDLEIAQHAVGLNRRWTYQGAQVRNLRVANQPGWPFQLNFQLPFWRVSRIGSVKFDYGPRTVFAAAGLDDAEGQMIVDWLLKRLPRTPRSGGS
jgi:hypothetical protein